VAAAIDVGDVGVAAAQRSNIIIAACIICGSNYVTGIALEMLVITTWMVIGGTRIAGTLGFDATSRSRSTGNARSVTLEMVATWTTVNAASILTADSVCLSSNGRCISLQEFVRATIIIIATFFITVTHNLIAASVGRVTSPRFTCRKRLEIVPRSWAYVELTQTITACCCVIACDLIGAVFQDYAVTETAGYIFGGVSVATALAGDVSIAANAVRGANDARLAVLVMEASRTGVA